MYSTEMSLVLILCIFVVFMHLVSADGLNTLAILETDTVTFQCPRSTSQVRLFVTHVSGHIEWYADFTRDNCATYRHMKCSQDTDKNILTVPVSNETRTIVSYSCGESLTYNISFYAGPDGVQCGVPELDKFGETITVDCEISRIYPRAVCFFIVTYNQSTSLANGEVNYSRLESFGWPLYYKEQCTLTLNVSDLHVGNHQLQLKVQPLGLNIAKEPYDIALSISLYPVKTQLDSLCLKGPNVVKGYIKAGTVASCHCMKEKDSKIFGTIYWTNGSKHNDIIVSDKSSALLTLSFPEDHNKSYFCKAHPLESNPTGTNITTVFAFGPDKLFLSKSSIRLELCTNTTITCSALSDAVNPAIKFEWFSDNKNAILVHPETLDSDLSSTVTINAHLPGKYILTCKGANAIFPELFTEVDIVVVIEERGSFEPKISIDKGHIVKQMTPSEDVIITCSSGEVSDLTFSCFNKTLSNKTTTLFVGHKLTKEDNGHVCSCTAKYSCYGNKTVLTPVYLAYGPTEFNGYTAALDLNLCVNRIITVSVPKDNAYPGIYFNISVNDPEAIIWTLTSTNLSATVDVRAQKVGHFRLIIEALNTFDKNIRIQAKVDIVVSDSSLLNPVLTINNGETVKEGISSDNVNITCKSSKTNSSQIILTCLGTNVTSNGTDVTIFKNLTRSQNGEKCYCQAKYHSSCNYSGIDTKLINVTYEANIVSFTANNNNSTIEVLEGENVFLVCIVDSNSNPNIYLLKEDESNVIPKQLFTNRINETSQNIWALSYEIQNIQGKQSSVYSCVAGNGLFSKKVFQTVTVIVHCAVQLANPSEGSQDVVGVLNGIGAVSFDLISYPEPVSFSLFKSPSHEPVDSSHFSYIYKKHTFYYGTLIVIIDKLKEENFTVYSVNVSNLEHSELITKFTLVKESNLLTQTIVIVICISSVLTALIFLIAVLVVCKCIRHTRKEVTRNELDHSTARLKKPRRDKRISGYILGHLGLKKNLIGEHLEDQHYDKADIQSGTISPQKTTRKHIPSRESTSGDKKKVYEFINIREQTGNKNKDESHDVELRVKKDNKKDESRRETKPLIGKTNSSAPKKRKTTQSLQDIKEEGDSLKSSTGAGGQVEACREIEVHQDQNESLATSLSELQDETEIDKCHYRNENVQKNGYTSSSETEDSTLINLPDAPDVPHQGSDNENNTDETSIKSVVPSNTNKKESRYSTYSINSPISVNMRSSAAQFNNFSVLNPSS